jgi:cytochrome c5
MTCPACAIAASNPHSCEFGASCQDCQARALAGSPAFHDSMMRTRFTTSYRDALVDVFGADWEAGHQRVKAWAKRISGVTT